MKAQISYLTDVYKEKILWGTLAVLGLSLVLSLGLFLLRSDALSRWVFYFPSHPEKEIVGEHRYLRSHSDPELSILLAVNEMLLGPRKHNNLRIVPRDTRIEKLLLRNDVVFLELSTDVLILEKEVNLSLRTSLEAIKQGIKINFPWVKNVILSIGGQEISFRQK